LEIVLSYSILVVPIKEVKMIKEDLDDNKFLECSLKANADYMTSPPSGILVGVFRKFSQKMAVLMVFFAKDGRWITCERQQLSAGFRTRKIAVLHHFS